MIAALTVVVIVLALVALTIGLTLAVLWLAWLAVEGARAFRNERTKR